MKKIFGSLALVTACIIASNTAKAQSKTTFGIRSGVNFQNINGKDYNGNKLNNQLIPGFHIGVNAEIPLVSEFFIQPGLLFTTKGGRMDINENGNKYTQTTHLAYMEVPVNFLYKTQLGTGHLLAGLGPYVEVGVGGKIKYSGSGAPSDRDVIFQNTVDDAEANSGVYYRRMGAGANFLFGYEFRNRLSAQLNAQLGLTNINPKNGQVSDPKATAKNTGFGVSLGYRF
jgi:hypothetical protein